MGGFIRCTAFRTILVVFKRWDHMPAILLDSLIGWGTSWFIQIRKLEWADPITLTSVRDLCWLGGVSGCSEDDSFQFTGAKLLPENATRRTATSQYRNTTAVMTAVSTTTFAGLFVVLCGRSWIGSQTESMRKKSGMNKDGGCDASSRFHGRASAFSAVQIFKNVITCSMPTETNHFWRNNFCFVLFQIADGVSSRRDDKPVIWHHRCSPDV